MLKEGATNPEVTATCIPRDSARLAAGGRFVEVTLRTLLVGAMCACFALPAVAQDVYDWNGFYAGVMGSFGNYLGNNTMTSAIGVAGLRHEVGNGFVVGVEGHAGYGLVSSYDFPEAGVEVQAGMLVGGNVLVYGSASYGVAWENWAYPSDIPAIGAGVEYAMNELAHLRLNGEVIYGDYQMNGYVHVRGGAGVLFQLD